ncbi:7095_t:CDS:2, partial [Racocetra fulgida]
MDNSDEFNSLSKKDEEGDNSDVKLLVSTSTQTSSTPNSNAINKKKRPKKQGNEQAEKVQCSFEGCKTEYLWKGSTTNLINHLCDIHQITKESLKDKSLKVKQQTIQQIILDMGELDEHHASDIIESVNFVLNKFNIDHQK